MMLVWLDPDRERAGTKYEEIRLRLIKSLTRRGCNIAEELVDESIDRVCLKVPEIAGEYEGDPVLYFHGVAAKVYLEYLRKQKLDPKPQPAPDPPELVERNHACLERCMDGLIPATRNLIVEYYRFEKSQKIAHRKHLAEQLGIDINALRNRALRIKAALRDCVLECLERNPI